MNHFLREFKGKVRVLDQGSREWVQTIDKADAEQLCADNLAVQIIEPGKWFVGHIELLDTVANMRAHLLQRGPAKGRPHPPKRAPESSTGDAGRGFALGPRYKMLHMERQAALA